MQSIIRYSTAGLIGLAFAGSVFAQDVTGAGAATKLPYAGFGRPGWRA